VALLLVEISQLSSAETSSHSRISEPADRCHHSPNHFLPGYRQPVPARDRRVGLRLEARGCTSPGPCLGSSGEGGVPKVWVEAGCERRWHGEVQGRHGGAPKPQDWAPREVGHVNPGVTAEPTAPPSAAQAEPAHACSTAPRRGGIFLGQNGILQPCRSAWEAWRGSGTAEQPRRCLTAALPPSPRLLALEMLSSGQAEPGGAAAEASSEPEHRHTHTPRPSLQEQTSPSPNPSHLAETKPESPPPHHGRFAKAGAGKFRTEKGKR